MRSFLLRLAGVQNSWSYQAGAVADSENDLPCEGHRPFRSELPRIAYTEKVAQIIDGDASFPMNIAVGLTFKTLRAVSCVSLLNQVFAMILANQLAISSVHGT